MTRGEADTLGLAEAQGGGRFAELERLARYYDLRHGAYVEDLAFYRDLARGSHLVLELGCGTGRLLMPLADEGVAVLGVESSPAMLCRARSRLEGQEAADRVQLVRADLRRPVCRGASLALLALNTFNHFGHREEQVQVLEAARFSLSSGGRLVLDLPNPHLELERGVQGACVLEQVTDTDEGVLYEWSVTEVDRAAQRMRLRCVYDLARPDRIIRETCLAELYLFYRPELELLLERTAFAVEGVFGDYDGSDYEEGSPRMLAVARAV
ncbi:MAG: class I SAM-dependent methyltransferase [Anaerolineae bacterium]|nr:class I SAM-dependent methyltransferase [Anaerolineae bacterium]